MTDQAAAAARIQALIDAEPDAEIALWLVVALCALLD